MRMLKKAMAAALSLVLCGSLVAPSFAAVEFDKGQHVDVKSGALLKNSEDNYDYYLGSDVTLDKTLVIGAGVAANIDLNGHTLQLNDTHSATVDSNGYLSSVSVEDSSKADKTAPTDRKKWGNVIQVTGEGADLTVTDSSALDEDGKYAVGEGTGAISGGYNGGSNHGAGVHVENGGSFTMKGGSISENQSTNIGGGIYVKGGTVDLDGVSVIKNSGGTYGGGIYADGGSTVTMKNVDVSQNTAGNGGGGVHVGGFNAGVANSNSTVTIKDSTITKNKVTSTIGSTNGGGIRVNSGSTLKMTDTEVVGNKVLGNGSGGGIAIVGDTNIVTIKGGAVAQNKSTYNQGGIYTSGTSDITRDGVTICSNNGKVAEETVHGSAAWDEGVVTKEATCKEAGVMTYTCKYCGETKTEPIPMLEEHSWNEGEETKAATCKEAGVTTYTCTVCGETKTEPIPMLEEHSWNGGEETKAATCKEAGVTTYTCTVCDETKTEPIPMLEEHSWNEGEETKVATCKEAGVTTYICTVCGDTKTEPIQAKGHTHDNWVVTTPAQPGVEGVETEICPDCGEELDTRPVEALPVPSEPVVTPEPIVTPDEPEPEEPTVEIDEPDVPLAGLPIDLEAGDNLTRGQLIRILHWMDSEPAAELATFLDVLADSEFAEAIGWAQANGIALDVGDNHFAPDEFVTRGQLIDFLNRYAQYVGSDLVLEVEGDADEILIWAEAEEIINDFFDRL